MGIEGAGVMAELRVEPVGPEAAELMHRLMLEAFAEYRDRLQPPTGALAETVADVAHGLAAGSGALAWLDDEPAGAVRFDHAPDHLYVGRLAVPPAYRGRGIAAALMAHAEERAAALGLPVVRAEVRSALPGNIAMFERLGFAQTAILPHPKLPSATTVTLEKPVNQVS
jgi:ribosomal protein S18 acetylase RimI-like enzyme